MVKISINFLAVLTLWLMLGINDSYGLPPVKLINIHHHKNNGVEAITLLLNRRPDYVSFRLDHPLRFVLDLKQCYYHRIHNALTVDSNLIKGIRVSQFKKDRVRLVIDQKEGINPRILIENRQLSSGHTCMLKLIPPKGRQNGQKPDTIDKASDHQTQVKAIEKPQGTISGQAQVEVIPEKRHNQERVQETEESLDSLFEAPDSGILALAEENEPLMGSGPDQKQSMFGINADFRNQTAYRVNQPHQFSKIKNDLNLGISGKLSDRSSYVLGSRFSYDAVFDLTDNYNDNVKSDQRLVADLRDAYLDLSWGNCDFRIGNQQIVWGQAVGLFFADIVNPKDLREYILPDLDQARIPIPAANIEYYHDTLYLQLIFIPFPEFNEFAKPGAEFDFSRTILAQDADIIMKDPVKPDNSLDNGEIGARVSKLIAGWDLSLFYLYDYYNFPTNYRYISSNPAGSLHTVSIEYRPEHNRVHRFGHTFSKEYLDAIFKGEFIYSPKMYISSLDTTDQDGISAGDTLDWLLGVDYTFFGSLETNFQLMQKMILDHEPGMAQREYATSISVWFKTGFFDDRIEPEFFMVSSFNQRDWLFRPKIAYNYGADLTFFLGADLFWGEQNGDFGRFKDNDRFYFEMLYRF